MVVALGLVIGSWPVSRDKTPIRVVINQGSSARMVGDSLFRAGVIRSRFMFLLTCTVGRFSEKLKPGVYEFNRSMDVPDIVKSLVQGDTLESWVTIPEGKTLREIADILKAKQLAYPSDFLSMTTDSVDRFPGYSFIYGSSLEGYLFPDTYLIARGTITDDIVKKMLDAFETKVVNANWDEIEHVIESRFGLGEDDFDKGLYRILIVASLVEREAKAPSDRAKISAVIWNRLAKNMKLQVDATVTYCLGKSCANKPNISYNDLENDSLFNTYKHSGLPPAPICNPGLASIKAALEPASIDALYYVAKKDGSHVFSKTLAEHDAAKQAIKDGKL